MIKLLLVKKYSPTTFRIKLRVQDEKTYVDNVIVRAENEVLAVKTALLLALPIFRSEIESLCKNGSAEMLIAKLNERLKKGTYRKVEAFFKWRYGTWDGATWAKGRQESRSNSLWGSSPHK